MTKYGIFTYIPGGWVIRSKEFETIEEARKELRNFARCGYRLRVVGNRALDRFKNTKYIIQEINK